VRSGERPNPSILFGAGAPADPSSPFAGAPADPSSPFGGAPPNRPGGPSGTLRPALLSTLRDGVAAGPTDTAPDAVRQSAGDARSDRTERWPGWWGLIDPVLLVTGYFTCVQAAVDLQRRLAFEWAVALRTLPRRLPK
jgi:hypothetical protein